MSLAPRERGRRDVVIEMTRAQRVLAAGLVLGVTLVAFETTSVITALPTITDDLGGDSAYGGALAARGGASFVGAPPAATPRPTLVPLAAAGELAARHGPPKPYLASVITFI